MFIYAALIPPTCKSHATVIFQSYNFQYHLILIWFHSVGHCLLRKICLVTLLFTLIQKYLSQSLISDKYLLKQQATIHLVIHNPVHVAEIRVIPIILTCDVIYHKLRHSCSDGNNHSEVKTANVYR